MKLNHKCDACRYKSEHQEMGFRPFGVCTKETNLANAVANYNAEVCPFDKKEFDEMRYLADEMGKAISTEYEKRYLADERKLEAVLKANGWRKASEVAREIFEEIEKARKKWDTVHNIDHFGYNGSAFGYLEADVDHTIYELKKKYTEGEG